MSSFRCPRWSPLAKSALGAAVSNQVLRLGCLGAAIVVSAYVESSGSPALAGTINWVDWTSTGVNTVSGNIVGNNVFFNGEYFFAQTVGGTNFWIPNLPYLNATVSNEPPASDIIALSDSGLRSLTFSTAVADPLFAYISLNQNTYTFDREFDLLSDGLGYWGSGSMSKVNNGNGTWSLVAQGFGEPHGVIQFAGTLSSLNWHVAVRENWNGFAVGVSEGTPASVPGPLGVLGAAAGFGWSRRIRQKIRATFRQPTTRHVSAMLSTRFDHPPEGLTEVHKTSCDPAVWEQIHQQICPAKTGTASSNSPMALI